MKNIVVYQSSTGFTKQYAEWIAQDLKCKAISIKEVNQENINSADCVIYGGWIMGNMISGLDKLQKMNPKKLAIFAVGAMPESQEVEKIIKETNHIEKNLFAYFQGGFHYDKLALPIKLMLKAVKKMAAKKENPTETDKYMAKVIGTSFDAMDRAYIQPFVKQIIEMTY